MSKQSDIDKANAAMNAVKSSGTLAFFGASGEYLWAWQQNRSHWPEGIWPYRWDGLGPAPIWLQCAVTSGDCFVHHKPATGFANLTLDQLRVGLSFADPSLYVGGGGLAFDTTDSDGMRQMELFMKYGSGLRPVRRPLLSWLKSL